MSREEWGEYSERYQNWPRRDALQVLYSARDKYLSGDWMAVPVDVILNTNDDEVSLFVQCLNMETESRQFLPELRRRLVEEYRWPHEDFRRDEWIHEGRNSYSDWMLGQGR